MIGKSLFIITLFMVVPFSIQGKPGLELTIKYDYETKFDISIAGTYKTDYIKTKIGLDHNKPFPDNISLKVLPVHKSSHSDSQNALAFTTALSLTVVSSTLLYIAKKEVERAVDNKYIDLYLERCDKVIKDTNPIFQKIEGALTHD